MEETAQHLRAHATLTEGRDSVPGTHIWQITSAYNSVPGYLTTIFWPLWAHTCTMYVNSYKYTHAHVNKK